MLNEKLVPLLDGIDGWLFDDECNLLYSLAKQCKGRGVIVEIGSWMGRSTICLGLGSSEGPKSKIYAIDPHIGVSIYNPDEAKPTFEMFKENIQKAGIAEYVSPLVLKSDEAVDKVNEPVELIFVDGDHSYEAVKLDFELWYPKLVKGGMIAFHDTIWWKGPHQLVSEAIYQGNLFRKTGLAGSITYAKKVERNNWLDRWKNHKAYETFLQKYQPSGY